MITNPLQINRSISGKKLVIVGAGRGMEYLFSTALEMGCEIYAIDRDSTCACRSLCHHFKLLSADDVEGISLYIEEIRPHAILASGYHGLLTVSVLIEKYGLWGSPPNAVYAILNKKTLREYTEKRPHLGMDYRMFAGISDFNKCLNGISYPVIVKDIIPNCGSRNIRVLRGPEDAELFRQERHSNQKFFLEKYFDWPKYGMLGVVANERLMTYYFYQEFNHGKLYPIEYLIQCEKNVLSQPLVERIGTEITEYLQNIGYSDGPVDVDLLVSPHGNEFRIIEIDPLLEGDLLVEHIQLCKGKNLDKMLLALALEKKGIVESEKKKGLCTIRFFTSKNEAEKIVQLTEADSLFKRTLHRSWLNTQPPPPDGSARDKWQFGYASFLFDNETELMRYNDIVNGGIHG